MLVSSSPAADETVETLPEFLTLTFSGTLIDAEDGTAVEVQDESGASAVAGAPSTEGALVRVPLVDQAAAGEYHVIWRVVSSDGHPISGEFRFTVSTGTAAESPEPTPEATAEPDETSETPSPEVTTLDRVTEDDATDTSAGDSALLRNLPWIIGAVILVGAIATVIAVAVSRRRTDRRDPGSEG